MKNSILLCIFLLSVTIANAQSKYDKLWSQVELFELEGKIKSADAVVDKILKRAKRNEVRGQYIKAFIYKSKFTLLLDEDAQRKIVAELESAISESEFPTNAILESVYAGFLEQYLSKDRYRIRQRTQVDFPEDSSEFEKWDIYTFHSQIARHYRLSLENPKALQEIPITDFEAILSHSNTSNKFRPTLFDFLVHRAINYYRTNRWYVRASEGNFVLNDPIIYKPTQEFVKEAFYTKDSIYSYRNALKLYQELELFHNDKDTTAYIDAVLGRLKFAKQKGVVDNRNELYFDALINLSKTYRNHESSSSVDYEMADFLIDASKKRDAKEDQTLSKNKIRALEICNAAIKRFPNSDGGTLCSILKKKVEEKELSIEAEQYVLPGKPFLAKANFKGVDSLFVAIYKIDLNKFVDLPSFKRDSTVFQMVQNQSPHKSRLYILQPKKNYYKYSTEIDIDPLDVGTYLIAASNKEKPDFIEDIYSYGIVTATQLSFIRMENDKSTTIKVMDRENGTPIEGVKISVLGNKGFKKNGQTDRKGEFAIKKGDERYHHLELKASYREDTLSTKNVYLGQKYDYDDDDDDHIAQMFIYLDRSIYRPGQTVYFKGLLVDRKNKVTKPVANTYVSIFVYDANDDEIKEYRLKTNEFGSVTGEFKIPKDALTGEFTIEMDEDYGTDDEDDDPYYEDIDDLEYAEVEFSVEEYKRPRFEVNFDDVTESYRIGDSIRVTGTAKALLGASISDAKVRFSITRKQSDWRYGGSEKVVDTGETTTNDKGTFEIKFATRPDSLSVPKNRPIFLYDVNADVIDSNGETRSASKVVKVGFHNLKVNVSIATKMDLNQPQEFEVKTTNLNGQPITANAQITIHKLLGQQRVLRKKPWDPVELPYLPKDKFIALFPNEPYDARDLKKNWKKEFVQFSDERKIEASTSIALEKISEWQAGTYELEVKAIDKLKDTVSITKIFSVYDPKQDTVSDHQIFSYEIINSDHKKDGYVEIQLRTACESLNVNLAAYHKDKPVFKETFPISKGKTAIKIPVSWKYEDRLDFNLYYIKFNSFYEREFSVEFPKDNESLTIETLSFRNKLTPDQKETWSFKITDPNGKAANAEVLASMYDTSLDQFKSHSWNTDLYFDEYYGYGAPNVGRFDLFSTTKFKGFVFPKVRNPIAYFKNYHSLEWYGLNFGSGDHANKTYLSRLGEKVKKQAKGNISGIVIDEGGLPLPFVNIIIKGTSIGTQTDLDGFYSINAPEGSKLLFSYLGYIDTELTLGKSGTYNMALRADAQSLSEVVIMATAGMKSKKALAYSLSYKTVKYLNGEIERLISGKAAGVNITSIPGANGGQIRIRGTASYNAERSSLIIIDGVPINSKDKAFTLLPQDIEDISVLEGASAEAIYGQSGSNGVIIITTKQGLEALTQVEPRNDLKETAFFFPQLRTNKNGELSFTFDSPEALTKWRLMLLAHTKNLDIGSLEKSAVTRKNINVIPNPPRFLRENDSITLSAKISNLTEASLNGTALLQLMDGLTMEPIGKDIIPLSPTQNFSIPSQGNYSVSWKLKIPEGIPAIQYKIVAKAGTHSDGETAVLPVLANRMLVTESRPLWVPAGKSREIAFEKLKKPSSNSQKNHRFMLEYTSNPAWAALKSLPYLMEFPHECAEQTFSRFYANALAQDIVAKNPKIEEVFKSWEAKDSLPSSLEENESLKSILISESPWAMDSKSDEENKSQLAQLFNTEKVKDAQDRALYKLDQLQLPSGGFPWFSGGRESDFITRHIVASSGHLKKLNVLGDFEYETNSLIKKAISYLDKEWIRDYERNGTRDTKTEDLYLGYGEIHYLYARSFFLDSHALHEKAKKITDLYLNKCKESWLTQSLYKKAMIALILHRSGDTETPKLILEALEEQSVRNEENGMYWKDNTNSWYWYRAPIETQALIIEAFAEIGNNTKKIESLKQWLLKHKQTQDWGTTKATTEAIYALLMSGSNWLSVTDNTMIEIGNEKIKTKKLEPHKKEAGTGYFKVNWNENEINPSMGTVRIKNKGDIPGYGGVYWQYFEDLDKITDSGESPMRIKKSLFLKKTDNEGTKLTPITPETPIQIGDLVTLRIEIESTDIMEFVHLKDMRASGFEPIDVLSEYKWQDGLGYYQSTKDTATHFFFDDLPKGSYVFEYDLRANNIGNFSNGISTLQSMYAPEYSSNSKGIRVTIKE
ncbi:carboxypeptidase-like regulatory domain-containing protein [Aureisphaera galaxeae]|uniref:alpha-2-macroglobulin family protein n=1 Tax=Aureisphaera galaxeae TaxID=1538023 RepID=UPI00234FC3A8|nr:MG2 domain-containing protein [Aureisphaera galaxeae]MDC8003121.1 carboxypeptidase-like regulatory domain-containing protein [Aureisphaera galaxeae]